MGWAKELKSIIARRWKKTCFPTSTSVTKQTFNMATTLNCLPDEIVLHIFECLDFHTLYGLVQVSRRFRRLAFYALEHYALPHIQLVTLIDQEGHGQWKAFHKFSGLDPHTFRATFTTSSMTPARRYKSSSTIAAPVVRTLSLLDLRPKTSDSLTYCVDKKQRRMSIRTCGVHEMTVKSWLGFKQKTLVASPWKLFYSVATSPTFRLSLILQQSKKQPQKSFSTNNERYITPMGMTIQLATLTRAVQLKTTTTQIRVCQDLF
ncbi:hypothetical protein CLU79DRAFT_838796 [Phycomyces nitens]|nr:hypothetical protein CLU79DRAFT_838796 [Phycomyces nitens]